MDIGENLQDFSIQNDKGELISFSQFKGKWVILYFYPKDNTPGCTVEAIDFSNYKKEFEKMNAVILGNSPDSIKSHQNFIQKKDLKISLLSDPDHKIIKKFGAWQLKKNYGREYYGVVRTTILINMDGNIVYIWNKVKAKGHAEIVKKKLSELLLNS